MSTGDRNALSRAWDRFQATAENFSTLNPEIVDRSDKADRSIWHGLCLIVGWEGLLMMAIKKVLIPVDFEEASDAALVYGRNLAKVFGAELHVLHVMENQFLRPTFKSAAAVEAGIANRVAKRLTPDDRATLHTVVAVRMSDEPADEIIRYADQENIDLIVMGTHGRVRAAHLLMGSVAEQVVRTAQCPVMTVHQPEHEFVVPDRTEARCDRA